MNEGTNNLVCLLKIIKNYVLVNHLQFSQNVLFLPYDITALFVRLTFLGHAVKIDALV